MADGLQILANLDVRGSTKQFNKDLKEIAKNLKAIGSPEFVAKLDVTKSQKEIQKELNTISKNLTIQLTPKINPPKSTGGGSNSIPSMAGQLFNTSDLDKAGVKYFKQVDDIVNRVKKEYSKLGDKTDVQLFKNAKGQIESFAVTLNKAGNVIEKFNFERAKLDTGSGKIAGFVQNKSSLSDKMSGTELQKTIAYMDTIEKQLRSINSNALNVSSPIKEGTKAYEQYNNKLQTTVSRITEIREANKILSVENKREINQIMLSLQEYVGSIKNSSKMNKSIFDTAQLDKDGVKYYQKVSNLFEVIKKDFASMGEASISATKNAKGQVDNLTVSVKKANGELEKFNFIKAKLNTGSTKVTGFVQDKSILGSNSKDLQSTIGFLNQIEKQLIRIDNEALHKRNPLKEDTKYYNDYIAQLNDTRTQIDNITKSSQVLSFQQREAIKKLVFELDQYTSKKKVEANVSVLPTQNVDNSKKIALEQLTAMESKYKNVTYATKELQSQYDALRVSLTQLRPLLNSVTDNEGFKDYSAQVQKLKAEFTAFNNNVRSSNAIDNVAQRAQVLAQRINTYIATNNNATKIYGENLRTLASQAQNATSAMDVTTTSRQFQMLTSQIKAAGMAGDDLFTRIVNMGKKFAQWYGVSQIFMRAISLIRQAVTNVKDLDSAMVSLKKVTDESSTTYNRFFENAAKSAKELNADITNLINSSADFAKLGFSLSDSEQLAKIATVYANVGELDISDASSSIVSTMKAFNIGANDAERIVDAFNQVGNTESITSGGIGEALTRSASAFSEANNTLSESIGLIVGVNDVVQNPETVGNMWKTVTMRIRGAKLELEEAGLDTEGMVESTSQLRDIVQGTTGFDIMADEKTFKSTYDIIVGIGKEWKKLDDITQASLLEKLAGKRQGNALAAALNNTEAITRTYQEAENSAGSAMAEQEKWANSIEAKTNKVASSFEYLSSLLVNSEGLKTALDLISGLMDGITSLLKNIGAGKLAIGTLFTALISHSMGLSKAFTFNGSSLMAFGKQFNIFNKSLMQTNQTMNYSLGTFKSAGNAIKFYNQDTEKAIKFQQQMRDTSPKSYTQAYIQSLNGAKGSMQGYTNFLADTTYRLQGASGAIDVYKSLAAQGTTEQQNFARALASSNPQLANFLIGCNGSEAKLRKFNATAILGKIAVTGFNVAVNLAKGVLMALASIAISKLVQGISNLLNHTKNAIAEANELNETMKQQNQVLSDLRGQYAELLTSTEDEATKNDKLKEIKKQLVEQYGFESDKIAEINQLRKEGLDLFDAEEERNRLDYIAETSGTYEKAVKELNSSNLTVATLGFNEVADGYNEKKIKRRNKDYTDRDDIRPEIQDLFDENGSSFAVRGSNGIELIQNLKTARAEMQNIRLENGEFSTAEKRLFNLLNDEYTRLSDKYKDSITSVQNGSEAIAESLIYSYKKVNGSLDQVYGTNKYQSWYDGLINKAKKYTSGNQEDMSYVKDAIDSVLDSMVAVNSEIQQTTNPLTDIIASIKQVNAGFETTSTTINEASESLQDLNQIVKDNESTDKFFSSQEIIELLNKYPELSTAIQQTAYGYKIEENALNSLRDAKLNEQKVALQAQLEESKSALSNAKTRLSAYAQEVKGIQTVAQAKAKLAEIELKYNSIMAKTTALNMLPGMSGFSKAITGGYNSNKSDLENYIQAMQNVDDYQGTIDKLQTQINVLGTSFEDIKNDTSDTNDNLDKQKDIVQEMQDNMKDAQEKINDLVDLTVDMLKKQKELEKDNLKEQLDGFKKIIDKRKELIDLEKEQHDFENDIAEKNKSVSEIQQKIDNLSLDDSLEGNKKRSELNKELADEKKKLDDFLYENEVEKRKQALDTEEELYEEKINNQTKMIEEYLSKDAILRQDAINLINSQSQQFYNDLYNYTQTYTEMSEYEFNKLWNSAYNALRSYGNGQIDVLNILAYLDGQLVATEYQLKQIDVQVNAIKNSADSASASLGSMADVAVQKLSNVNQTLASFRDKMSGEIETYNNNKSWSLAVRPDLEYLSKLPKFHSGGLVGGTSQGSEILAKLLTGEVVSTQSQAENFVSKTLPNLFQGAIKLSNNVQQSPNVSININVEGNADDTTINKLKSTIQNVVKDTFSEINGSKRRFGGTPNAIKY